MHICISYYALAVNVDVNVNANVNVNAYEDDIYKVHEDEIYAQLSHPRRLLKLRAPPLPAARFPVQCAGSAAIGCRMRSLRHPSSASCTSATTGSHSREDYHAEPAEVPHIWGTAPVAQWRTRFPNGKVSRHPSDAKNVTRPALPGPRERGLAISAPVLAWSWQSARACVRTCEGIVLHLYLLSL